MTDRLRSLDGLRGYAAMMVVLSHCVFAFWPQLHGKWITDQTENWKIVLFESPASFFYNGTVAVYVFFALSGYVLSVSFFRSGENRSIQRLFLQRYTRLAIPIAASCVLFFMLWKVGAIAPYDEPDIRWTAEWYLPDGEFSLLGSLRSGFLDAPILGSDDYNVVLWTMKIEFWGSVMVFANCLLLKGLSYKPIIYGGQILLLFYLTGDDVALYVCFFVGMLLAEHSLAPPPAKWLGLALIAAVILGSFHRSSLIRDFLPVGVKVAYVISAGLLLWAALHLPKFEAALRTPVAEFLGRISFSLYLTHMAALLTVGLAVYGVFKGWSPNIAGLLASTATIGLSLALARLFEPIDVLAVHLSRSVAGIFMNPRRVSDQPPLQDVASIWNHGGGYATEVAMLPPGDCCSDQVTQGASCRDARTTS